MAPFRWTDREVRRALGLATDVANVGVTYARVSTDSRSAGPGHLFVALVGERFDGHDFVPEAFERGAAGAVVSRDVPAPAGQRLHRVPNTLEALGALAHHRRLALSVPVVGITGSAGKTTTKDLVRAALSARYRVHATEGNLNNLVGLPLTVLAAPDETEVLVLEMGTNQPGEIAALTRIAEPTIGVVTRVAEGHLEGLGDLEGVLREKLALIDGLPADGVAIVAADPPVLAERARALASGVRVAGTATRADAELRGDVVGIDPEGRPTFRWRGREITLRLRGRHSVDNALLALAVADALGVPEAEAAAGVATVEPGRMRGELVRLGGLTLLVDCYNANPASVAAALDLMAQVPSSGSRVVVLGTMRELGQRTAELHERTLRDVFRRPLDLIVATGEFAAAAERTPTTATTPLIVEADVAAAYGRLRPRLRGDELVLLKASRGVRLERLIPEFRRDFASDSPGKSGREV